MSKLLELNTDTYKLLLDSMAHVFNYFTRLCRRHAGICPEFLAFEIEEASTYLLDIEEILKEVNMDNTGRTISVAFVVIFGLLLAFTVSALESYTGALFVGKFADNLVRIIYVLEELTLHLGLITIKLKVPINSHVSNVRTAKVDHSRPQLLGIAWPIWVPMVSSPSWRRATCRFFFKFLIVPTKFSQL
jgi:hypothetical protein